MTTCECFSCIVFDNLRMFSSEVKMISCYFLLCEAKWQNYSIISCCFLKRMTRSYRSFVEYMELMCGRTVSKQDEKVSYNFKEIQSFVVFMCFIKMFIIL